MKVETGNLLTPSGERYNGFKITIGDITDPATIVRRYDDIEKIMGKSNIQFKTHEEEGPTGKFRSYSVEV